MNENNNLRHEDYHPEEHDKPHYKYNDGKPYYRYSHSGLNHSHNEEEWK